MSCRAARRVSHVHPCHNRGTRGCEQFTFCLDPDCPVPLDEPVLCPRCCLEAARAFDVKAVVGALFPCRVCHQPRPVGEPHVCPEVFAQNEARLATGGEK